MPYLDFLGVLPTENQWHTEVEETRQEGEVVRPGHMNRADVSRYCLAILENISHIWQWNPWEAVQCKKLARSIISCLVCPMDNDGSCLCVMVCGCVFVCTSVRDCMQYVCMCVRDGMLRVCLCVWEMVSRVCGSLNERNACVGLWLTFCCVGMLGQTWRCSCCACGSYLDFREPERDSELDEDLELEPV